MATALLGAQHAWRAGIVGLASMLVVMIACDDAAVATRPADDPETPAAAVEAGPGDDKPGPETPAPRTDSLTRADEELARDAGRKPHAVMDFFEIAAGARVVELMAGRGYYTELLAARVGPGGKVWAHNSPFVLERFAESGIAARMERLTGAGIDHVARLDHPLDDPHLPADLDAVVMVLFYHDTYWQEVDRARMNEAVFAALRPGGVFGLVDHRAEEGSKDRDVKSLHRVDEAMVKAEVLAAGFVLDAESDLLTHPEDPRTTNVFEAADDGRDQTDRFVLRFRKPGSPPQPR